jgi:site-specific DNA-methyltransferase (adenine-specific)
MFLGKGFRNAVYNCDCNELLDELIKNGVKCDICVTDPPYNIGFKPPRQDAGEASSRKEILNDKMDSETFLGWITEIFKKVYAVLKDDSFMISFCGWSSIPEFMTAAKSVGFQIKSMPIWVKESFGIGYYTRPQYEPMLLCIKGNPKPPQTPISDVLLCNRDRNIIHSCQKPISLISKLINTFSKEGDLVLDPFMGSFATAVAARRTGRDYIGSELDDTFYENGEVRLFNETNQVSLFDL